MINLLFIQDYLPLFLNGVFVSLQIAFFSCLIGTALGITVGVILSQKINFLSQLVMLYVVIIRGTPMLIQIVALSFFAGSFASLFWIAIISIGLNSGAYVSQIILTGINSIGIGQTEAAKTLGFNKIQIIRYIILPQAIKTVLPALGNELITLVKDSSLASTIGVSELTKQGAIVMSQTLNAPAVYIMIGAIYLTITTIIIFSISALEKRMQYHAKH